MTATTVTKRLSPNAWKRFASDKGLQLSPEAKVAFQQKVGLDTRVILNELEKIATALGGRKTVEKEDIANYVSASREAAFWDLADAFAERDLAKSLRILRQLVFQRQNLMGLIINLERRIHDLLIVREGIDRGWMVKKTVYGKQSYAWGTLPPEVEQVFSEQMDNDPRKIHPFRAAILARQAAGFSRKRLEHCQKHVVLAHEQMVSSRVPPDLVMEILLVRMLGTARRVAKKPAGR
jgi:DNA polymerase III delta subunit